MVLNRFNLNNKIAIVTGGAGYYGKPICVALAEAGAHVILASRNEASCRQLAEEIRSHKFMATGYSLDLADGNSIRSFVNRIIKEHGAIDVLVNNAVSREGYSDLEQVTKESWEKAAAVNLTGLVLLTQAVVEQMKRQNRGNIINIGSIQGTVGPNFPVYGETGMSSPVNYTMEKWAMVGFTKWIANYYGKFNIRCNCISPGGYGPGVNETFGENEFVTNYKRLTPLGRFADDEDIKGPIVFLASDASAYITGHNLLVDGGWTNW